MNIKLIFVMWLIYRFVNTCNCNQSLLQFALLLNMLSFVCFINWLALDELLMYCKRSLVFSDIHEKVLYVFKGDDFWKVSEKGIMDGYPKKIKYFWRRLPSNVDASLYSQTTRRTYFFKGSCCLKACLSVCFKNWCSEVILCNILLSLVTEKTRCCSYKQIMQNKKNI